MRILLQDFQKRALKRTKEGSIFHMHRKMRIANAKVIHKLSLVQHWDEASLIRGYVRMRYFRLLS